MSELMEVATEAVEGILQAHGDRVIEWGLGDSPREPVCVKHWVAWLREAAPIVYDVRVLSMLGFIPLLVLFADADEYPTITISNERYPNQPSMHLKLVQS